ncbi:MAG: cation-translocating P-type ATPase family protein [Gemmataceae bacterium]
MHREISHVDSAFEQESNLSLYLLTGLLGILIGADLWPALAGWLQATFALDLPTWPREIYGYRWALIAAVLGGARVLYTSLESLFEGRIGADLALAIAAIAAILFNKPLVAAEVVFIGLVGECLEGITFARTQRAIQKLVEVFPRRCWLLRDGQEVRIFTHELQVGDRIVVKPGAKVPVDGKVIEGRSAVDLSALTGESLPVDLGPGDAVLAGSVNQFGALTIEAEKLAEHTVAGKVIELTSRALKDKVSLERTADRMARYFLPVVLVLAALTFVVALLLNWTGRGFYEAARLSIDPTLAVLVVACPCALILATPAAIIAALGRLAGTGILIKGGSALERLAAVEAIAFDKTGTLTEGKLELGDLLPLGDISVDELLRVAASAELKSEHPLAVVVVAEARRRNLTLAEVADLQTQPGAGVIAQAGAARILVGNRRLLEEQGFQLGDDVNALLTRLDASGQTPLLIANVEGDARRILGVIGARDRMRAEAAGVLAQLRAIGIDRLALLTGDRRAVADSIARQLDIAEVHAELLPADKAAFLQRWREVSGHGDAESGGGESGRGESGRGDAESGRGDTETRRRGDGSVEAPVPASPRLSLSASHPSASNPSASNPFAVAMVGDGINDAPALARADVGLAIGGTGADIAAEAGDVVFMGDPLEHLPLLIRLSRETVRIIRQNIVIFAFGVNGLGILLTAWLWPLLTPLDWHEEAPLAAVLYHQLGSLAVLLNSMRLLWFERAEKSPTWQRLKAFFRGLDERLARLDPHELSHWLEDHWQRVAVGAVAILLAVWLASGFTQVGPDEIAIVQRFGRPLEEDLGPGLHWHWPWPIDRVTRMQPARVHVVEVGFRPVRNLAAGSGTWSTQHRDVLRLVEDEAVMITGDGNLVELLASIRYTINAPRVYHFEVDDPAALIRATAESVLREAVSDRAFLELLTADRERFQQRVQARLEERCRQYGPHGLGIEITGLFLPDLHPPLQVVDAYHEVARAMENRDRTVNQAEAMALRTKSDAQAEAVAIVDRAEASKVAAIESAQAEFAYFMARLQARSTLGEEQERALQALFSGQPAEYEKRRAQVLAAQRTLNDFRLFWDALGQVLAGRDKVLIDADKVPGRRQLLLFDPDQFRVPVPLMLPNRELPERGPVRDTSP